MKNQVIPTSDAQPGAGTPKPETDAETVTRLNGELAVAKQTIARHETADADRAETEKIVRAKMALGLTRQQALSVIERQKVHDLDEKRKAGNIKKK